MKEGVVIKTVMIVIIAVILVMIKIILVTTIIKGTRKLHKNNE